jgi:hypothetical protein
MAVTMKSTVFWDVTPYGSCRNPRFGRTSVLRSATGRNIPEDDILLIDVFFQSSLVFCTTHSPIFMDVKSLSYLVEVHNRIHNVDMGCTAMFMKPWSADHR